MHEYRHGARRSAGVAATARTLVVIPARHASVRFPGKALAPIRGAQGQPRPLIERCWRAACAVPGVDGVVVATDDARIRDVAQGFGAEVVMTSSTCENGTERCAEALARLGIAPEIVVNLQGDAPLTPPWFVTAVIDAVRAGAAMATPVLALDADAVRALHAERRAGRVGGTTAVMRADGTALYFSREVLPHGALETGTAVHLHAGVYAYTAQALADYVAAGPCAAERAEGLEQLRFLHHAIPVTCVPVTARGQTFHEVNHPEDVPTVEAALRASGTP